MPEIKISLSSADGISVWVQPPRRANLLTWMLGLVAVCAFGQISQGAEAGKVDFNFQVRPLLSDRCFKCHGPDEKARKKQLRLDLREGMFRKLDDGFAVVRPGNPKKSELIRRIFATDPDEQMPPPDSHLKLSAAEKEVLQRWVAQGAEFKPPWSLIPVAKVSPPRTQNKTWPRNPIDIFVLAKLEADHLSPAPAAPRETLLRRLALDLTGLPPSEEELDAFLADDASQAYERAVGRYLSSPAYGEWMAVDWLDLARFADTYGYQADVARDLSAWRDWVIRAFNDNLPYSQFLEWQLAGDLLPHATRDQRLATAFNRLHRQTNEGGSIEEEFRAEYVSDRVNTFGTAMLGFTLGCARCHDHKYDPIKQREYYSLSAFFNNIDESGLYPHFTHATPTPTLLLWPPAQEQQETGLQADLARSEQQLQRISHEAQTPFQLWLNHGGKLALPRPVAHFNFNTVTNNTTPDLCSTNTAQLEDGPVLVRGASGASSAATGPRPEAATNFALQFSGDNQVVCNGVGHFTRTDPFSFGLWLKPTEPQDRAVVLHYSRAWTDSGSRGYELVLDHGRPFFGLIHFWPGNAIAVRAKQALATNEWSQLCLTYDGSSRAAGLKLYCHGAPLETEVVRDHLYKDITHRSEWGDADVGNIQLTLGARFRDHGFKNGMLADVQVFDVCLTAPEVEGLAGNQAPQPTLEYFLARQYEPFQQVSADLRRLRRAESALANDIPEIMTMAEMPQPRPTYLLKRGAYDAPGEPVQRDTPASLPPFPAGAPRDRLGLAQWLIARNNPLTARVVVNRIWKMHFGRGIVATPDDFGSQGKLPTHPELLDWLAGWFRDHGWDVKALHQLIVESATYQQSSQTTPEIVERDPEDLLLSRWPRHRLQAEQIRDSALADSGLLNHTLGGPSVKPYQPPGLWEAAGTGGEYAQDTGDKLYRRSLYTFLKRTVPPPAMLTFDATSHEVCTAKRETTTTPLQALVLLNDPQFVEAARFTAERLLKAFPADGNARIRSAFRQFTGREPDATELKILNQLLAEQAQLFVADPGSATKLLATGASKWDETLPRAEFAATTTMVSALMNFDEFIVER